jgi:maleate isomerase
MSSVQPGSLDALASRAKIGIIVPATNSVVQPEMDAMRPRGVTNHVSRMLLPKRPYDDMKLYRQALENEKGNLEEALNQLSPCEPHVIAHGHSIHSFRGNLDFAQTEAKRLEDLIGIPFITPSLAILAGLKAVGNPKRIAVLTPYWPPADSLIQEFFVSCGYNVVAMHGLKAKGPTAVAQFSSLEIMQGFRTLQTPDVEAFIHVGTNLAVSFMTPQIEAEFGKPLIGVNTATYWWALRRIGVKDSLPGFGTMTEQ